MALYLWMPLHGSEADKETYFFKGYEVGKTFIYNSEVYKVFINAILTGSAAGLALIAIFLFRKRPLQMLLCWLSMLLMICAMAFVYYKYVTMECAYDYVTQKLTECYSLYTPWNALGAAAVVMLLAAFYYIRRDEELIKSEARLR